MSFSLDNYFGIYAQALKLRGKRTELLAANIANADTPGFKAQDLDFRAALEQAGSNGAGPQAVRVTHAQHLKNEHGGTLPLLYRVPLQPSQDGNTVDAQLEQAAFAENAVRYQASLDFLNGRITSMITALRGDSVR